MEAPGRVARRVGKRLPIGAGREPQAIYVELLMAAPPWLVLVADDMPDAMRQVADTLVGMGHRRIGIIAGYDQTDCRVRMSTA